MVRDVVRLSRTIGAALLAAPGPDELDAAIDDALSQNDRDIFAVFIRAGKLATVQSVQGAMAKPDLSSVVVVLGAEQTAAVQKGMRLSAVAASELLRLMVREMGDEAEVRRRMEAAVAEAPLAFVHDASIPLPVREILLGVARTLPILCAIGRAVSLGRRLPAWQSTFLTEAFERGQNDYLRLVASTPGTAVAEGLVPRAERMDMDAIVREHADGELRYQAALGRARCPDCGIPGCVCP